MKTNLLETEEEVANYIPLGLNDDYDQKMRFTKSDLVLLGGRRGSGKSFTCANLAWNQYKNGKKNGQWNYWDLGGNKILSR